MKNLEQLLMDRALNTGVQGGVMAPPPSPKERISPANERWQTAEEMKAAYRNNWQPNPILLKNSK